MSYFFQTTMTKIRWEITETVIDDCLHYRVLGIDGKPLENGLYEMFDNPSIYTMAYVKR